jgi:hypothetical protein
VPSFVFGIARPAKSPHEGEPQNHLEILYRSPEARDRRVAKTVEDAIAFAERKT